MRLGASKDTVFIATGAGFADALAVSAFAASEQIPILLTQKESLPEATADFLDENGIGLAYIVGGTAAISPGVKDILDDTATAIRLAGDDRYHTAYVATEALLAAFNIKAKDVSLAGIATGENFPDALSGGAAVGARDGILALTKGGELHAHAKSTLSLVKAGYPDIEILGGTAAISEAVRGQIEAHMGY